MNEKQSILHDNGGVNLVSFKTKKGSFKFIAAKKGSLGVLNTIDSIINLDTKEITQHQRMVFVGIKAEKI